MIKIELTYRADAVIIRVRGRMHWNAGEAQDVLNLVKTILDLGRSQIVLDLSQISLWHSLSALDAMDLWRMFHEREDAQLRMVNQPPRGHRHDQCTFGWLFSSRITCSSVDEAIASLRAA